MNDMIRNEIILRAEEPNKNSKEQTKVLLLKRKSITLCVFRGRSWTPVGRCTSITEFEIDTLLAIIVGKATKTDGEN